jgi:hypothetical protein
MEDDVLVALELAQRDFLVVLVLQSEVGRWLTYFEHVRLQAPERALSGSLRARE